MADDKKTEEKKEAKKEADGKKKVNMTWHDIT